MLTAIVSVLGVLCGILLGMAIKQGRQIVWLTSELEATRTDGTNTHEVVCALAGTNNPAAKFGVGRYATMALDERSRAELHATETRFLLAHGWTQDGPGTWRTPPGYDNPRTNCLKGHAVNSQKQRNRMREQLGTLEK